MDQTTIIYVVAAVVAAVIVIAVLLMLRKRRTDRLRAHFGPEYDHAMLETGRRGKAETSLREREKRVDKLTIRPLTATERDFYLASWDKVQAQFVDDPGGSVIQADQLLGVVMSTSGYSVADFEQRAADVSVEHPLVVEHYRAGHEVAVRHQSGLAATEDLRQAMIHYRTLFNELVGVPETVRVKLAS